MNKLISAHEIASSFPQLILELRGEKSVCVDHVASCNSANRQSLVYANQLPQLEKAIESGASVILTSAKLLSNQTPGTGQTFLVTKLPDLAFAFVTRKFFSRDVRKETWWHPRIHPTAVIASNAILGQKVIVGPNVVIGARAVIGDHVYIGPNSVIEEQAHIGSGSTLHSQVFIGHNCVLGKECEIHPHASIGMDGYGYAHDEHGAHYRIPHQGRVVLGDRVDIGANCAIDRGTIDDTRIGEGTKMDNLCHIAHNTQIGKFCLITACFVTGGSARLGDYVIVGGRSTISGHRSVSDRVHIGAHAGVTQNITEAGEYSGYPLQPLKDYLKTTASVVHLPRLRRDVARLIKKVFPEDNV